MDNVTTGVSQILLNINIAGRIFNQSFAPSANLSTTFDWDGKDSNGNYYQGPKTANITITYNYTDGTSASANSSVAIGHWEPQALGIGGWSISNHHFYDPEMEKLYLGDGGVRNIKAKSYQGGYLSTNEAGSEAYFFNLQGQHLKTLDTLTGKLIYKFQYNQNKLISVSDRFNNITTINSSNSNATITSPYGQITQLNFDQNGWVSSITNPNNEVYQISSSSLGLMQSFRRPSGKQSLMVYDSLGLLKKDSSSFGDFTDLVKSVSGDNTIVRATSAMGRQNEYNIKIGVGGTNQTFKDPQGLTSSFNYNPEDSSTNEYSTGLTEQTVNMPDIRFGSLAPFGTFISSEINSSSLIKTETRSQTVTLSDNNDLFSLGSLQISSTIEGTTSKNESLNYKSATKTLSQVSAEGRIQSMVLNDQGVVAQAKFANLLPQNLIYDQRGRLIQSIQGQKSTTLTYDNLGNVASVKDSLGLVTRFTYDNAGRVTAQIRPDGKIVKYKFDSNDNLINITPTDKPTHVFNFNPSSELLNQYLPPQLAQNQSAPTNYQYNLDKQLIKVSKPSGKFLNLNYDNSSGVLNSITANDARRDYFYSNQTGLINRALSSDNVNTNYQYVGPLVTNVSSTGAISTSINFEYNKDFLVSKRQIGSSTPILYEYDKDNLITQAGDERIDRDTINGLVTKSIVALTKEEFSYNSYGELEKSKFSFNNQGYFEYQLQRDIAGRITSKTEIIKDKIKYKKSYSYDNLGRLIGVSSSHHRRSTYKYDANGNRIEEDSHSCRHDGKYKYDSQDRLIKAGDTDYTYTADGDLQTKMDRRERETTNYSLDSFGVLKSVQITSQSHRGHHSWREHSKDKKLQEKQIDYIIDAEGKRVGKKVNGVLKQAFVYESPLRIAAELDGNGQVVKQFIYGTKQNIPDYVITSDGKYRIYSDHLGSPRLIVNVATGKLKDEIHYDEFGRVLDHSHDGFIPFGFAGGLYDIDTELVHFGARDYDPEVGRWISKDPILFGGGDSNLYSYTFQNPVNFVDSDGKAAFLVIIGAGAIAGGVGNLIGTYIQGGSYTDMGSAFLVGAIAGGTSLSLAYFTGGTYLGGLLGTLTDLGLNALLLPTNLPNGLTANDLSNGLKKINKNQQGCK